MKNSNSVLTAAAFCIAVVFAGLFLWSFTQMRAYRSEMLELKAENTALSQMEGELSSLRREAALLRNEIRDRDSIISELKYDISNLTESLEKEKDKLVEGIPEDPKERRSALIRSFVDDPDTRSQFIDRQKGWLARQHSRLFKMLKLNSEAEEQLVELMAEANVYKMGSRMIAFGGGGDSGSKADQEEIEQRIKDLLQDKYPMYQNYMAMQLEYTFVDGLNRQLKGEEKISEEKIDELATMIHQVNSDIKEKLSSNDLSSEERRKLYEELKKNNDVIIQNASGMLSDKQLELFRKQAAQLDRMKNRRPGWGRRRR